jgi:hypothetical protein
LIVFQSLNVTRRRIRVLVASDGIFRVAMPARTGNLPVTRIRSQRTFGL